MKIELRKISYSKALSEETSAYTADLYIDGILTAHVSNRGHGGGDEQHPAKGKTNADIERVEAWITANIPVRVCPEYIIDGKPMEMKPDLETVCGELLETHLVSKDLQRILKRTIAYFDPAKKSIFTFKGKIEGVQRAETITTLLRKTPDAVVLNNLPFDEALKVFRNAD